MDAFSHHHSMLYKTYYHRFLLKFTSSSLKEIECVEATVKTSFGKEMGKKSSPQAFLEDVLVVNGEHEVSSDDFSVDNFFDFTNEEGLLEQQLPEQEEEVPIFSSCSNKRQKLSQEQHFSDVTISFDYTSLSTDEFTVPADDVASLEWLSHFVEDSFSEHSVIAYPIGTLTEKPKLADNKFPEQETPVRTCFKTPVPGKTRSNRSRTGGQVWFLDVSPLTESSSTSTPSSSSSLLASTPWFVYSSSIPGSALEPSESLWAEKMQKKRPTIETNVGNVTQPTCRCSYCGVIKKTPQWRAGSMGANT